MLQGWTLILKRPSFCLEVRYNSNVPCARMTSNFTRSKLLPLPRRQQIMSRCKIVADETGQYLFSLMQRHNDDDDDDKRIKHNWKQHPRSSRKCFLSFFKFKIVQDVSKQVWPGSDHVDMSLVPTL